MLSDEFNAVMRVTDSEHFRAEVVSFTRHLGFDTVDAIVVVDSYLGASEFIGVDHGLEAYRSLAVDLERGRRDPVMRHCKRSSVPIVWDRNIYVCAGQREKWEEESSYGYSTGLALAPHLPQVLHFFIGVDRDQPLPASANEVTRLDLVAELQLFASVAREAAMRTLLPGSRQTKSPNLTPREL